MPSPTDTLLRIHDSPVPTHTFFVLEGSIATAPIDCTFCRSNTGLKVVPPFTDFHTPPLAEPTNSVMRPSWFTPATAAMRPLMVADPMLRAVNPETVALLICGAFCAASTRPAHSGARSVQRNKFIVARRLLCESFIISFLLMTSGSLFTLSSHFVIPSGAPVSCLVIPTGAAASAAKWRDLQLAPAAKPSLDLSSRASGASRGTCISSCNQQSPRLLLPLFLPKDYPRRPRNPRLPLPL